MPEKISVSSYSGYRGDESPRAFSIRGERIEVIEIMKMWLEEDRETKKRKRFFTVKGSDGFIHKIFYDEETAEWFSVA